MGDYREITYVYVTLKSETVYNLKVGMMFPKGGMSPSTVSRVCALIEWKSNKIIIFLIASSNVNK